MPFPSLSSTTTLDAAEDGLRRYAEQLKVNSNTVAKRLSDGTLTGQVVENYLAVLRTKAADVAPFAARLDERLVAHIRGKQQDDKLDVIGEFTHMAEAAQQVDAYIPPILEKNQSGKLGTTFPESALPGLQAVVEALLATID